MTRAELITELHAVRAEMETLLADVGETWLTEPGALPGWSVKDILAHITSWEVDLLTNLGKVRRGVKPGKTRWASAEIQAQNEKSYAELKDRPLHTVLANKYYFDVLYERVIVGAAFYRGLGGVLATFDRVVIDSALDGAARALRLLGGAARHLQTGQFQTYGALAFSGLVVATFLVLVLSPL